MTAAGASWEMAWLPAFDVALAFRFDALSAVMLALVLVVGVVVVLHARRSLPTAHRARVLAQLLVFAVAMAGLVLADDLIVFALFWEATSVLSFLLVGTKGTAAAVLAARRALAVTGGGGLAMLAGIVVLSVDGGTTRISELSAAAADGGVGTLGVLLVLLGVLTKSAQWPFHGWLPGAMAAPAPVSAYLHSATMVKAGVYLALRLVPTLDGVTSLGTLVASAAVATMLWGGWQALRSDDLKRLLAFSTVSQLGLMLVVISVGTSKAVLAAIALLVTHALAKAALFLSVDTLEADHGVRDLAHLRGAARRSPVVGWTVLLAFSSLAGVPLLGGWVAKEAAFVALVDDAPRWALIAATISAVMTAGYALRVVTTLWTTPDDHVMVPATAPRRGALLLAAAAAALGLGWLALDRIAGAAATAIVGPVKESLALIPEPNLALLLSLTALVLGVPTWRARIRQPGPRPAGRHVYDRLLDLPARGGDVLVRLLRPGSLDRTVGLIVLLAAGLLLPFIGDLPTSLPSSPPLSTLALAGVAGGAIAAAVLRHRFGAVLALGLTGFALAGWFATRGGADVALTLVLVEMVIVLAFLLLLRELPDRVPDDSDRRRNGARVLAALAAAGIGLVLSLASTPVGPTSLSDRAVARSIPDASGRNVVNVVLTDYRALDTFAEIAVLAIAAVGARRLLQNRSHA